ESLRALDAQDNTGDLIDMRHDAIRVDQDDTIFDTFEDCFGFALLIDQPIHVQLLELLEAFRHPVEFGCHPLQFRQGLFTDPERWTMNAEAPQMFRELSERLRDIPRKGP